MKKQTITIGLALFIAALSACKKEDVQEIIKKEQPLLTESAITILIGGSTTTTNAYAAYCKNAGKEFLAVSNDSTLLDTSLTSNQFDENDFLIYFAVDGTDTLTYGGTVTKDTISGTEFLATVFDFTPTIVIDSITSSGAYGSMNGTFSLPSGNSKNYSVTFSAGIIKTSPFCN